MEATLDFASRLRRFHWFNLYRRSAFSPSDHACKDLLRAVDALDAQGQRALASQIGKLWQAFTMRFDGVGGYLERTSDERNAYQRELTTFIARYKGLQGTPQESLYLSVALVLTYTSLLGRATGSAAERQFGGMVARMIDLAEAQAKRDREGTGPLAPGVKEAGQNDGAPLSAEQQRAPR